MNCTIHSQSTIQLMGKMDGENNEWNFYNNNLLATVYLYYTLSGAYVYFILTDAVHSFMANFEGLWKHRLNLHTIANKAVVSIP